jgi:hypothetical protein
MLPPIESCARHDNCKFRGVKESGSGRQSRETGGVCGDPERAVLGEPPSKCKPGLSPPNRACVDLAQPMACAMGYLLPPLRGQD